MFLLGKNLSLKTFFSRCKTLITKNKCIDIFEKLSIKTLLSSVFQQIIMNNYKIRIVNAYNSNLYKLVLW